MDVGGLGSFVAIYEDGSITKAAKRLFISPQGLSKSLAKLEAELGIPLFSRTHKGVVPTKHAIKLYPHARDFVQVLDAVRLDASSASCKQVVRMAMVGGQLTSLGLSFIEGFEAEHPDIELRIEDCTNQRVGELVMSGGAEVGFMAGPIDVRQFDATPFASYAHVLIVSDKNPLAAKPSISYQDLENQRVAVLGEGYPVRETFLGRAAAVGVYPTCVIDTVMPEMIVPLAAHDELAIIGASHGAYCRQKPQGVAIVPFEDAGFSWDVFIVTRVGAAPNVAVSLFKEYAVEWSLAQA